MLERLGSRALHWQTMIPAGMTGSPPRCKISSTTNERNAPLHMSKQSLTRTVVRQNHVTIHVAGTQLVRRYDDGSDLTIRQLEDSSCRGPRSIIVHHFANSSLNEPKERVQHQRWRGLGGSRTCRDGSYGSPTPSPRACLAEWLDHLRAIDNHFISI
ncbi:hypothetical protein BJV77DRAFT_415420 [Russula vinacea]|nr:hypothetical protein BJV77DRAFT_415420 [Russula vinacea]